jgi:hypothetical protein
MFQYYRVFAKQSFQRLQRHAQRLRQFSTGPAEYEEGVFRRAWNRYQQLLDEKPLLTKSVTSGAIALASDATGQYVEHKMSKDEKKTFEFDIARSFRFTLLNTLLVGPVLHYWYGFIVRKIPGTDMIHTLQRVFVDQLVFGPTFVPVFFGLNLLLEGRPETIPSFLNQMWWPTVKANWSLWVPAMLINFKFVPPNTQVLFANVVAYFWNIYLSMAANSDVDAIESAKE